jgi:hypothetical protein
MNSIPVVAFKGKGGSGKSTAANYFVGRDSALRTSFADPLKMMIATLLRLQGVDEDAIERMLTGDLKESPTKYLGGKSPRVAMQLLGTEFGRALHPDFWVNIWRDRYGDYPSKLGIPIVVDDCRFANEAEAVRSLSGFVIEIRAPGTVEEGACVGIAGHASEAQDFDPDIIVINDGKNLEGLHASIDEAMDVLTREAA